jgi:xanthine dehydrogenase accessory factor
MVEAMWQTSHATVVSGAGFSSGVRNQLPNLHTRLANRLWVLHVAARTTWQEQFAAPLFVSDSTQPEEKSIADGADELCHDREGRDYLNGYLRSRPNSYALALRALVDSSELQTSLFASIRDRIQREDPFVVLSVTAGLRYVGQKVIVGGDGKAVKESPASPWLPAALPTAHELLGRGVSDSRAFDIGGVEITVFFDVNIPPPRCIIIGATQTAQSLTRMAKELGYRVIVVDARTAFATRARFPEADELVKGWPQDVLPNYKMDESTYVVLLTHDPKFDEPTLHYILPLPVRYIGAIGSRRTQEKRRAQLRLQGFSEDAVAKIHGPVGLDLGGKSAAEIALSIVAEMTAVRNGRRADGKRGLAARG